MSDWSGQSPWKGGGWGPWRKCPVCRRGICITPNGLIVRHNRWSGVANLPKPNDRCPASLTLWPMVGW